MARIILLTFAALLPLAAGERIARKNLIDEFLFSKMEKDSVPHAPISSDEEFLRRVTLDLTGRVATPAAVRAFLADKSPEKRDTYIESLFPKLPTMGIGRRPTRVGPYLDRWSTFFGDMFRNNEQLREGINSFHDFIYKSLELNVPYDEFVRDMITSSGVSTWTTGPANFVARHRVMAGDGYSEMNHEDTADELAIWTSRLFLGVDMECFSCHDGKGHLEKVSLWHSQRKRAEVWRQAAWFGKTFVAPVYGRIPEFRVNDSAKGYDLATKSVVRLPRYKADLTPTFILDGAKFEPKAGETERQQYARLLTSHPQFARATVNLFWAELMGKGIVDPPFGFDMDRQDPANPPPAPWTIQPSHPELLNALAEDFRKHNYDLRHLMRMIVRSNAYQLSSYFPGKWDSKYDTYFARHNTRRMAAEEFWDAVQDATGIYESFKIKDLDRKFKYVMEAHFNQDFADSHKGLWNMLQDWGQTDREDPPTDRASMVQAASLLNHELILERVKVKKGGRLEKLLAGKDEDLVGELFLATIGRMPKVEERNKSMQLLTRNRERGAEDLLWALLNRVDFIVVQ